MPTPVCKIFLQGGFNEIFGEISSLLSALGVSLANPRTTEIYCYDPCGERHVISKESSWKEIIQNYSGIQFWRAFDDDIFVSWGNGKASNYQFCFYLDGLDVGFRVELIKSLAELIFRSKFIAVEGAFLILAAE